MYKYFTWNEKENLPEWIQVWPCLQWVFLCLKYQSAVSFGDSGHHWGGPEKGLLCPLNAKRLLSHFLSCWRPQPFVRLLAGTENTSTILQFSRETNFQYSHRAALKAPAQDWMQQWKENDHFQFQVGSVVANLKNMWNPLLFILSFYSIISLVKIKFSSEFWAKLCKYCKK